MSLGFGGVEIVKESEKSSVRRSVERTIKEQSPGRQKMVIAIAFKFLKIVDGRQARNHNEDQQTRKETIRIERAVTCS